MPTLPMTWTYTGNNAGSADPGVDPLRAKPGSHVLTVGVDGRVDGAIRRYPGHVQYDDTGDALGAGTAGTPAFTKAVEFQKTAGSTVVVRGLFVKFTDGSVELWWRDTSETAGTIHKTVVAGTGGFVAITAATDVFDAHAAGRFCWYVDTAGNNLTIFYDSNISALKALPMGVGTRYTQTGNITLTDQGAGRLIDGYYGLTCRFHDTARGRFTKLLSLTSGVAALAEYEATNAPKRCVFVNGLTTTGGATGSVVATGTAQAGGASSITLASGASAVNDYYKGMAVLITAGLRSGQMRYISAYNGTTKVATVSAAWTTGAPDNTSVYSIAELGFDKVQVFTTRSSEANASATPPVHAGGTLYAFYEGSVDVAGANGALSSPGVGAWQTFLGSTSDVDDGVGGGRTSLTDDSFALLTTYDIFNEDVYLPTKMCAIHHLLGVTYVADCTEAYIKLRWSNPTRFEPENFPNGGNNFVNTRIRSADAASVRFVEAGGVLYLIGGTFAYRIERNGINVAANAVHQGIRFLHRDGIVGVGSSIFAATDKGIVIIDAAANRLSVVPSTRRLFMFRWADARGTTSTFYTTGIIAAYDAKMDCVYFLNKTAHEAACIWLEAGRMTFLWDVDAAHVVSSPDLDGDGVVRAYWLNTYRTLATAKWDATAAGVIHHTMNGYPSNQTASMYTITAIGTSTIGPITYRTVTLNGAVFGSVVPARYNQVIGSFVKILAPVGVGTNKNGGGYSNGQTYQVLEHVLSGSSSILTLNVQTTTTDDALIEAGQAIVVSPIPLVLVGSPLWGPQGVPSFDLRKLTTDVFARITGLDLATASIVGAGDFKAPWFQWRIITDTNYRYSEIAFYYSGYIGAKVRSAYLPLRNSPPVVGQDIAYGPKSRSNTGAEAFRVPDSEDQWLNEATLVQDGMALYPMLLTYYPGATLDVLEWGVRGTVDTTRIAGPMGSGTL